MIFDTISNFHHYCRLSVRFAEVADFFATADLMQLPQGRLDISDQGVFALVSEYKAVAPEECFIECHQNHIDIQIVAHGAEQIGFCAKSSCKAGPYDTAKDFQKLVGKPDWLTLRPGHFALFFPDDGHMPKVRCAEWDGMIRKIVIKVPVEEKNPR
jgi:biofilm protein TabA